MGRVRSRSGKGQDLGGVRPLLDTQVLPKWEKTAVGDIDWQSIQKWIGELGKTKPERRKTDGLSASRVVEAYHVFRAVLGYAVRARMLSANPATDIDLPRKPESDKQYLTHQQVADLAAECGEHDVLVLVLAYCGLRWGEATHSSGGISTSTGRGSRSIRRVEHVGEEYRLGSTKTHERREVPISRPCSSCCVTASNGGHLIAWYFRR